MYPQEEITIEDKIDYIYEQMCALEETRKMVDSLLEQAGPIIEDARPALEKLLNSPMLKMLF